MDSCEKTDFSPQNNRVPNANDNVATDTTTSDNANDSGLQKLLDQRNKYKQTIINHIAELYFLQQDGLMCEFQDFTTKQPFVNFPSFVTDDDIISDTKFSQLLNLKIFEEINRAVFAVTATTTTTTQSATTTTTSATSTTTTSSLASPTISRASAAAAAAALATPPISVLNASNHDDDVVTTKTHDAIQVVSRRKDSQNSASSAFSSTSSIKNDAAASQRQFASPATDTSPPNENSSAHPNSQTSSTTTGKQVLSSTPISTAGDSSSIGQEANKRKRSLSPVQIATDDKTTNDDSITHLDKRVCGESPSRRLETTRLDNHQNFAKGTSPALPTRGKNRDQLSHSKDDSPTRISKVVDPIVSNTTANAENHQKQIYERAKHEATVVARIAELRKQGLWSAKRLPKLQEPPRPKTHWDYVLEEMRWLSSDFDAERKWKRRAAKRCALMVYRYHQEKRSATERAEREQLQHIKKLAATQAKEIRSFWSAIEKIVDFRQQTKLEETRKKHLGLHLNYILDQTTKFSNKIEETTNNTKELGIDYLMSQEGENKDKEPVINNKEEQVEPEPDVDDIAAGARSIQPKGNTLESTTVSTKVPFLLKHSLREYQHIGLDWLVAMHEKKINGMLADEMGLGKTIQTIALLAHLACEKGDWGPHLIVVPTSVMLNWEMEFKKWCPAFKILTYYGNPKERRMKRVGWSRPNSFHVCITSYRIVIQDHAAFRRKRWTYFILDEAHYIKNFKSQRWQMLLNFNSQHRLLLTGTPLQNNLMELWSLMHFLMPQLFESGNHFKEWFVNPLTGIVEGTQEYQQKYVQKLHHVLRPFLLRRLKADVEKQLPKKREFIKTCRLSKRQRFLYEEFMSLAKTKETLATGNFLSVINVLMQLRKVCNHPNLFEPRPTVSPFMMSSIAYKVPGLVMSALDYDPFNQLNLMSLQLLPIMTSMSLTSSASEYVRKQRVTRDRIVEVLDDSADDMSSMSTIDDTASVQEVNDAIDAIQSDKINEAYQELKKASRADRMSKLELISNLNESRCARAETIYHSDIRDHLSMSKLSNMVVDEEKFNVFSNGNALLLCSLLSKLREDPKARLALLSGLMDDAIKTPEQLVQSMTDIIERFVFCIPSVSAPSIRLHVSHMNPSKRVQEVVLKNTLYEELAPRFGFMSRIISNMRTNFPELRLIEYDCGKLQTLGRLLNELKSGDHRVLIFTQMSRMLDILEQFLNYHGHTYLRLDGSTKIDQRQILMERFNNDKRIFCFILSTRSGGIGVNLTGADTVIFYDSDWNPTMDAQAQDRCHRIGQTKDVHIYRLISEDTIEKNIFMKAQQKRMLGDLAIEEGNFNANTSFKREAINDLFKVEPSEGPVEVDKVIEVNGRSEEMSKAQLSKLEQALSKGEVEAGEASDVDAIKVARADEDTDLREFDESIPLTEENSPIEKSDKEQQIDTIVSQMTPIEQFAVKYLESLQKPRNKEELEQAEAEYRQELENKKSQWEQTRLEMLKEQACNNDTNETLLTYPRGAKCDHVHFMLDGEKTHEEMPLWAPPTPPTSPPSPVEENTQYHYQPAMTPAMAARINAMGGLSNIFPDKKDTRHYIDEKDVYVDLTLHFLYEPNIMSESQLPPVNVSYSENETTSYTIGSKKIRLTGTAVVPGGYYHSPSQPSHLQQHLQGTGSPVTCDGSIGPGQSHQRRPKIRRDEVICLPKSIFDRQTSNFAKIRRELKLQKLRCVTKGNDSDPFAMQKFFHSFAQNPLGQSLQQETIVSQVSRQMQQYNDPTFMLGYHQEHLPAWTLQEEWALLMVIQHLQDLPVNLCILTPGHTPNWELVSEVVSDIGFTYRSYKMCEYHFALKVQKLEMTRDSNWDDRLMQSNGPSESPPAKKSKKHKNQQVSSENQSSQQSSSSKASSTANTNMVAFKPSKLGSMLAHDKSLQVSFGERFDIIKRIRMRKPKTTWTRCTTRERVINNPTTMVRDDKKLIDYDRPLKPETVILEMAEERRRRVMDRYNNQFSQPCLPRSSVFGWQNRQ